MKFKQVNQIKGLAPTNLVTLDKFRKLGVSKVYVVFNPAGKVIKLCTVQVTAYRVAKRNQGYVGEYYL